LRALVTGGAGFIGRWLVQRLLAAGHSVLALDNLSSGSPANLAEFEGRPGFLGLLRADLCEPEVAREALGRQAWDLVFHLAASINVQRSIDAPAPTLRNDWDGTALLLEACREQYLRHNGLDPGERRFEIERLRPLLRVRSPRVLVMSTCMVYAPADGDAGIAETHPLRPGSPYAAVKAAADLLALSYFHAYAMPVTVARPFNTYGPFQRVDSEGGVVSIFLSRALAGQPLLVRGDGRQTRDLLYVEDCAEFLLRAVQAPAAEGEVVNAGSGRDLAILDLARRIAPGESAIGFVPHDHPQAEIARLLCDPRKAERLLGWRAATSLDEGLGRTREWLRASGAGRR